MAKVIAIDNLADEIMQGLENYNEEVEKAVADECKKKAKEIKKELENNPNIPVSNSSERHYKKSFAVKKGKYNNYTIYNKKYQLTHLLEYGHETTNGGRTRAFPHWEEANKKAQDLVTDIKKRLGAIK